jgi:hypothetical protein
MIRRQGLILAGAALLAALGISACDGNPAGPSDAIVVRGTVIDETGVASASAAGSMRSTNARITVTVEENRTLTTTVSGNGEFELTGLPDGSFTLAFSRNGVPLGTVTFSDVQPGQRITIKVKVSGSSVDLVEDDRDGGNRTCAVSGGKVGERIELEGRVALGTFLAFDLDVNGNRVKNGGKVHVTTSATTAFKCHDKSSTAVCTAQVLPSTRVHVRGRLVTCDMTDAVVTADEVKVQK